MCSGLVVNCWAPEHWCTMKEETSPLSPGYCSSLHWVLCCQPQWRKGSLETAKKMNVIGLRGYFLQKRLLCCEWNGVPPPPFFFKETDEENLWQKCWSCCFGFVFKWCGLCGHHLIMVYLLSHWPGTIMQQVISNSLHIVRPGSGWPCWYWYHFKDRSATSSLHFFSHRFTVFLCAIFSASVFLLCPM